jgi:hypothetical protein
MIYGHPTQGPFFHPLPSEPSPTLLHPPTSQLAHVFIEIGFAHQFLALQIYNIHRQLLLAHIGSNWPGDHSTTLPIQLD